jgi:glyoxylate reductase
VLRCAQPVHLYRHVALHCIDTEHLYTIYVDGLQKEEISLASPDTTRRPPRILVTRAIPRAGLDLLAGQSDHRVLSGALPPSPDALLAAVREGWTGIVATLTERIDAGLMDSCPGLRVVANMAVGFDNIDVPAATARGIMVTNTPGVLTETTADLAWMLLMAAGRGLVAAQEYLRGGRWKTWEPEALLGQDIYGATLGLVGLGRIGQAVARRARGFDMRILYTDPVPQPELAAEIGAAYRDLPDLLREADFVSVHIPLTPQTRHLFGKNEFGLMKSTAVFVNTSRGPIVDQKALYQALRDRVIFAAGIDVFESEPVPLEEPLLQLENCVSTPHIGSASVATRNEMARLAARNALAALSGERPPSLVNPETWQGPAV